MEESQENTILFILSNFFQGKPDGNEPPRLRFRSARGDTSSCCHSDWSDERSEERNGGISLDCNPFYPLGINTVASGRWYGFLKKEI